MKKYIPRLEDGWRFPGWAFVADGVQHGDLMVILGRGGIPFILREAHNDGGAREFLFLGPALFEGCGEGDFLWELPAKYVEEFILV